MTYTYHAGEIEKANINKLMAERDVIIPWAHMPNVGISKVGKGKDAKKVIRVKLECDMDPALFPNQDVTAFMATFAPVVMFSFRPGVLTLPSEEASS